MIEFINWLITENTNSITLCVIGIYNFLTTEDGQSGVSEYHAY